MIETTTTAECRVDSEPADVELVPALRDFLAHVPDNATLEPITQDRGSQRDPWRVMVGLRATWKEQR